MKKFFQSIDWQLLLFLILFLDVKIYCKIIAILLIYAFRFDFRFGFRWRASRLPLFYAGVIGIALLNWLLYGLYADCHYAIAQGYGIMLWVLGVLAIHQVKLSVERSEAAVLHRTLLVFFVINAAVSLLVLFKIMLVTGSLNPYAYQGEFQKYYIGTGDYIKGLTFDVSVTNALINAFGVIYFLSRRQVSMALTCMLVLLLTGSNTTNLLLVLILVWLFIFRSDRDRKSLILLSLFLLILFMVKVSPQNREYVVSKWNTMINRQEPVAPDIRANDLPLDERPDSVLTAEERKKKIAIHYLDSMGMRVRRRKDSMYKLLGIVLPNIRQIPTPDIHSAWFQTRDEGDSLQSQLIQFVSDQDMARQVSGAGAAAGRLPGKIASMRQTARFLAQHPWKLVCGNGMGRFSSKLAFRTTALGIAGRYPLSLRYMARDFRDLHLAIYLFYFTRDAGLHSMLNTPDSVYDQLITEYGLAGMAFFIILYIGFFTRHRRKLSYGLPLLFIMGGAFFTGYWFEQLSVVVLFEFMILLDIREGNEIFNYER